MGAKALVCLMCVAQAAFLPPGRVGRPRLTPSMSMRKKETKTRLPPRAPAPIVTPKTIRVQLANKKGVVVPSKERVVGPVPQFDERGRRLDEYPEYWLDPRMHSLGNVGLGGRIHAMFAPLFTHLIDRLSYGGMDVRRTVHETLPANATVLDLACGTGFSTAKGATGVDTSKAMLDMARFLRPDATFIQGNAETYGPTNGYDIVTVMFATHEMPMAARRRVLRNAARVAKQSVIVMDIDPNFERTLASKPGAGESFLAGEPYVLDYLKRMDGDVKNCVAERGWGLARDELLPEHCVVWRLTKSGNGAFVPFWGI